MILACGSPPFSPASHAHAHTRARKSTTAISDCTHLSNLQVDWSRWVDSDDEGADDFDASAFSAFGGGRAGMEEMLARMGADPGALPGLAGGAAAAAAGGDEGSDDRDDDALPTLEAGEAGAEMAAV